MANIKRDASDLAVYAGMHDDEASKAAVRDWHLLRGNRSHVLVAGAADAVERSLAALIPHLDPPVWWWSPDALLPSSGEVRTLVIRNVDTLPAEWQRDLLSWLDQAAVGRVRVVSTTTAPLFQRVACGLFLDTLYYRLNMLMFDGADAGALDVAGLQRPHAARAGSEPIV